MTDMEQGLGATAALADWVSGTTFGDLEAEVSHATKRLICDSIACAIGARGLDSGSIVIEVANEMGGAPEATVLGGGTKVGAAAAAFANGYLGNALDADETLYNRGHHAVATVFPALALAERIGASGADLIVATALGYDVGARIGSSLAFRPVAVAGAGFQVPSSLGWISFAAATAAGKVLGLEATQLSNALGIAGWTSPLPCGLRWQQITAPKPMMKYVPYGFASQQGVLAAQLASRGFTADPDVLDGDRGYWKVTGAAECDWKVLLGDLGSRWWVQEASFKPYASGRYSNFAIDLFRDLVRDHHIEAAEIDAVRVWTISHAATHWFNNPPQTQTDMPFSIPIALAAVAVGMDLGPQWQSWDTVRDPRLPALARRVEVYPNNDLMTATGEAPELPAIGGLPTRVPTKVEIHARGEVYSATTDFAWGDPWSPDSVMTDDQMKQKFRTFCAGVLRSPRIEEALDVIFRLDEVFDINQDLMPLLR